MAAVKHRRGSLPAAACGAMEVAIPALIGAILGAFVLHRFWAQLPAWAAGLAVLVICALGLLGLCFLSRSGGMAVNMERMERDKRE